MSLGMIGQKAGMTRIFDSTGVSIPVTVISFSQNMSFLRLIFEIIDKFAQAEMIARKLSIFLKIYKRVVFKLNH